MEMVLPKTGSVVDVESRSTGNTDRGTTQCLGLGSGSRTVYTRKVVRRR